MNCGKCNHKMTSQKTKAGPTVDICGHCRSIFFDKGEIESFTQWPQKFRAALEKEFDSNQPTERKCPRCQIRMNEGEVFEEHLVIDRCPLCHGIFLDAGELRRIVKTFQAYQVLVDDE